MIDPIDEPTDNSALIGGIVGGVLALLLLVGLIGFFAWRRRRARSASAEESAAAAAAAAADPMPYPDVGTMPPTRSHIYGSAPM
jgi:predicted lipid-binding transport protein (Tim44 family)